MYACPWSVSASTSVSASMSVPVSVSCVCIQHNIEETKRPIFFVFYTVITVGGLEYLSAILLMSFRFRLVPLASRLRSL